MLATELDAHRLESYLSKVRIRSSVSLAWTVRTRRPPEPAKAAGCPYPRSRLLLR